MSKQKYQYRVRLYDYGELTKEAVFKHKTEAQGYGTYFKFKFGVTFTVTKEPVEEQ